MQKEKLIRIFVDAHVFDSEFQGTRTFIKEIYLLLAKKPGLLIFLAATDIENLKLEFPDHTNIRFVKIKSGGSARRLLLELPALHRRLNIDIAHYQYVAPPVKNTRYLITTHDVIFNDYPDEFSWVYRVSRNLLFGFSAKQADILTTVSEYSKKAIGSHLSIGKQTIHVIPNGVHPRFFEDYDQEKSRNYIVEKFGVSRYLLYVSRFEPRKNHILLLQTFLDLKLAEKGHCLVLLGHKSLQVTNFQTMYDSLSPEIKSRIFISSEVTNSDLLEFYRGASVFVYPSKAEGFGIPPLEAAALKIPVLCSNTSAMKEFTFFGENHFDPNNVGQFKSRLKEVTEKGVEELTLKQISGIIAEKYSWQNSAEKLYNLLLSGS